MPRLVAETWRPFAHKARRINGESLDEELHAARILAKRTRYAAEAAAQCLGPQSAREAVRFAKGAEEIQNILGDHQDAAIARRKLMDMAAVHLENGPLSFALGRLIERQSIAGDRSRRLFDDAWRRFDQKGKRTWLNRRGSR
jgi:CHAD domain-containing protein